MAKNYHTDNKSFIVYKDWEEYITMLSDEESGRLFKALFAFSKRAEEYDFDGAMQMVFIMMRNALDRDGHKWEETCAVRSEIAKRREANKRAQKAQLCTNSTDKDKEKDTDTDKDTDTEKEKDKEKDKDTDTESESESEKEKEKEHCPAKQDILSLSKKQNNLSTAGAKHTDTANRYRDSVQGHAPASLNYNNSISSNSNDNSVQTDIIFGEYCNVKLSQEQYDKLISEFGQALTKEYIKRVDEYCEMKGREYGNCYLAISRWIKQDTSADNNRPAKSKNLAPQKPSAAAPPSYDLDEWEAWAMNLDPTTAIDN